MKFFNERIFSDDQIKFMDAYELADEYLAQGCTRLEQLCYEEREAVRALQQLVAWHMGDRNPGAMMAGFMTFFSGPE